MDHHHRRLDPEHERADEVLLGLADGCIGSTGSPLWTHPAAEPRVLAAGVYTGSGPETTLAEAPAWQQLDDLALPTAGSSARSTCTPACSAICSRATSAAQRRRSSPHSHSRERWRSVSRAGGTLPAEAMLPTAGSVEGTPGGIAVAAATRRLSGAARVERLGAYVTDPERVPQTEEAAAVLAAAGDKGFEVLLTEHRAAWGARWEAADVVIDGDADLSMRCASRSSP